jgi:hypothetical protein
MTMPYAGRPWYAPLVRIAVLCGVLLTLQLLTATNYDVSMNGEAGTLAGVLLVQSLLEFRRPHP